MLQAKNKTNFFSSLKKNKEAGDVLKYSHMYTGNSSSLEVSSVSLILHITSDSLIFL
jgi:hypothetical protein